MSGATVMTDLFPSQTAISLYFTATGTQGLGAITGSATLGTVVSSTGASASATPTTGSGASQTMGSAGAASTSASGSSSQSSSTSKGGAAPTGGAWIRVVGAVAGAAIVAAL